jgi:cadmium resistance protein CadD (predicted permease)
MLVTGASEVELAALVLVTAGGFVATNLDNLLILVGLLGAGGARHWPILLAFALAAAGALLVALLGGLAGTFVDPGQVGYLGLLPIALGCAQLYRNLCVGESCASTPEERSDQAPGAGAEAGVVLATFLVMASNSGDSIALFLPLFAESRRDALVVEVATCLLMILLWCHLAKQAVRRPVLAKALQRQGRYLVPLLMIAVGGYVLLDTGTDTL